MGVLEQFLLGLTLIGAAGTTTFFLLWTRELDRHAITRASRDGLRHTLKEIAVRRDAQEVADAIIQHAKQQGRPLSIRLADEQEQMRSLREADHHALQEWK